MSGVLITGDFFMLTSNIKVKQETLEIHHLSVPLATSLLSQIIFEYWKNIFLIFCATHNVMTIDMTHF